MKSNRRKFIQTLGSGAAGLTLEVSMILPKKMQRMTSQQIIISPKKLKKPVLKG